MNIAFKRVILVTMSLVLLLVLATTYSYTTSKNKAIELVGKTYQYFPLQGSQIAFLPVKKNRIGWYFRFLHIHSTEDFEIFTNLKGDIVRTFPRDDLAEIFRKYESAEVHPYSNEAAEIKRKEWEKEKQLAHEKGVRLFEESPFKKSFLKHFELSKIEAPKNTSTHGVHFFGNPEWWATLTPKKFFPLPCQVFAIFPIRENDEIEVSITPVEIENAINTTLTHPYVVNQISNSKYPKVWFRITGDRLHWDTPELQRLLGDLKVEQKGDQQLRYWARVVIDSEDHELLPLYINIISGELIYMGRNKKGCSEPILVKKGNHLKINTKHISG